MIRWTLCGGKVLDPMSLHSVFSDQIIGKGLILLLHGSPGVGKTTTAGTSVVNITLLKIRILTARRMCCRFIPKTVVSAHLRFVYVLPRIIYQFR